MDSDRTAFQYALSALSSDQPASKRLSTLDELSKLVQSFSIENISSMWMSARDLLDLKNPPLHRKHVIEFMGALSHGENFSRLGPLRQDFFDLMQGESDVFLQMRGISYLTKNAQACGPFEMEIQPLLLCSLSLILSHISPDPTGHLEASVSDCEVANADHAVLEYTANFLKFNSAALSEEQFSDLVAAVCALCERTCDSDIPKFSGRGDEWNLQRGCLDVIDVVLRYSVPSSTCLPAVISALCRATNQESCRVGCSRDAWRLFRGLLQGDSAVAALEVLTDILRAPTSPACPLGPHPNVQMDQYHYSSQSAPSLSVSEHGSYASAVLERERAMTRLRGAVYLATMGFWSAERVLAKRVPAKRVKGLWYPRRAVIDALLTTASRLTLTSPGAAGAGEWAVSLELVMSAKRLVGKLGEELEPCEWRLVLDLIYHLSSLLLPALFHANALTIEMIRDPPRTTHHSSAFSAVTSTKATTATTPVPSMIYAGSEMQFAVNAPVGFDLATSIPARQSNVESSHSHPSPTSALASSGRADARRRWAMAGASVISSAAPCNVGGFRGLLDVGREMRKLLDLLDAAVAGQPLPTPAQRDGPPTTINNSSAITTSGVGDRLRDLEDRVGRVAAVSARVAPDRLVLRGLELTAAAAWPGASRHWRRAATNMVKCFLLDSTSSTVRLECLRLIRGLVRDFRAMYEEELLDAILIEPFRLWMHENVALSAKELSSGMKPTCGNFHGVEAFTRFLDSCYAASGWSAETVNNASRRVKGARLSGEEVAAEAIGLVWEAAADLSVERLLEPLISMLVHPSQFGVSLDLRTRATRSLLSLLPYTLGHSAAAPWRACAVWEALVGLLAQDIKHPDESEEEAAMSATVRAEVVGLLCSLRVSSGLRPVIFIGGQERSCVGLTTRQTSSTSNTNSCEQASASNTWQEHNDKSSASDCTACNDNHPIEGINPPDKVQHNMSQSQTSKRGPTSHEGILRVDLLFNALCFLLEHPTPRRLFSAVCHGLIRCLCNRFIFNEQDTCKLVQAILSRIQLSQLVIEGPRAQGDDDFRDQKNEEQELLHRALGLCLGGWDLPPDIVEKILDTCRRGLTSPHNHPSNSMVKPELDSTDCTDWPKDADMIREVIVGNGRLTCVCLDILSLSLATHAEFHANHLSRVMDVLEAVAAPALSTPSTPFNPSSEACASSTNVSGDTMDVIVRGVQYMKMSAVIFTYLSSTGLSSRLHERSLKLMLALGTHRLQSHQRRGELVANIALRSIALWYSQTSRMQRAAFARDVVPALQASAMSRDDSISATILDWILRHSDAVLGSGTAAARQSDLSLNRLFRVPGSKYKAYAAGDCILTVRSTPLGLVEVVTRRPTDQGRWILLHTGSGGVGTSGAPATLQGLLHLLAANLQVAPVFDLSPESEAAVGTISQKMHGVPLVDAPVAADVEGAGGDGLESSGLLNPPRWTSYGSSRSLVEGEPVGEVEAEAEYLEALERYAREAEQRYGEAVDPDLVLLQWGRGPLADLAAADNPPAIDGCEDSPICAPVVRKALPSVWPGAARRAVELQDGPVLERAIRLLDLTPLTFTHKFGLLYCPPRRMQSSSSSPSACPAIDPGSQPHCCFAGEGGHAGPVRLPAFSILPPLRSRPHFAGASGAGSATGTTKKESEGEVESAGISEGEMLRQQRGSVRYNRFLEVLGEYLPLCRATDEVFTGGLDKSSSHRDGRLALFWRNGLTQVVFFVATLMPNEPGPEQVNKKRFIGNSYVKVIYLDSDSVCADESFSLDMLSGQFNMVALLVVPVVAGFFRIRVLRKPSVAWLGPIEDVGLVPERSVPVVVRSMLIDADVACMMAASGDGHYSSNWQERLRQLRQIVARHSVVPPADDPTPADNATY